MATAIVKGNAWLKAEGAQVFPQGSYHNNTNVRLEADMDLRVQLPGVVVHYMPNANRQVADARQGYYATGRILADVMALARAELEKDLIAKFGAAGVDATGNKAIRVHGLDGSRADCDIVPAFRLEVVTGGDDPFVIEGIAIMSKDGSSTWNFPDLHHYNGVQKRTATAHRFKRVVRMMKQLNYELEWLGDVPQKLPSFLVECLGYAVEDAYYLVSTDDAYDRLLRVLKRLQVLVGDTGWCAGATEINGIKYLFHPKQAWTEERVRAWVAAAIQRLEA